MFCSTFSGSSKQGFVITDTCYIGRHLSDSPHKQCFPTLDILPRRDFQRRIHHSMNIGHQLHPSFFFFFAHHSSSSDSEEITKAHDIKTDGFINLFPVFTMDLLGIILLATGISLFCFPLVL